MRDTWSVFDVIGPVMVGPSSSHTAGACKLGYMARIIFGPQPKKAILKLHGSFGEVYAGHCTDIAIIGGLLGMLPWDPDIQNARAIAKKQGMEVQIIPSNLGNQYHPNTVQLELSDDERSQVIIGESIGAGRIRITQIDKVPVSINGAYSCLLVEYDNTKFDISKLMDTANKRNVSFVNIETTRYKNRSIADIQIKEWFERDVIFETEELPGVHWARFINHTSHYGEGKKMLCSF